MILVCSQGWELLQICANKILLVQCPTIAFDSNIYPFLYISFFPLGEENGPFSFLTWPFVSGVCTSLSSAVHRMRLHSPWSPFPVFSHSLLTLSCLHRLTEVCYSLKSLLKLIFQSPNYSKGSLAQATLLSTHSLILYDWLPSSPSKTDLSKPLW